MEKTDSISLDHARAVANVIRASISYRCAWDSERSEYLVQVGGDVGLHEPFVDGNVNTVKGLVFVVVPERFQVADPTDLLGERYYEYNQLYRDWAIPKPSVIEWIKPGEKQIVPYDIQETETYWRGYIRSLQRFGIQANMRDTLPDQGCIVEFYLAEPDNFGLVCLFQTGSAAFVGALRVHVERVGYRLEGCYLARVRGLRAPQLVSTPTEADVFRELNLKWVKPQDRWTADDVRGGWDEADLEIFHLAA